MTLLDSLLDAIVRLDGEALIMHVGEKPYVVLSSTTLNAFRGPLSWGQVELSSRPLSADAVMSMLGQMLSPEQRRMLDEFGAIEHEIDAPGGADERFVVTAARGGDDVWVEVRRQPKPVEGPALPEPVIAPAVGIAIESVGIEGDAKAAAAGGQALAFTEHAPRAADETTPGAGVDATTNPAESGRTGTSAPDVEAAGAARGAALRAEAETALAAQEAALAAAAEASLAGKVAALAAEAEMALAAKEAALAVAAEASLAEKLAALTAEAGLALAAKEAALAAAAETSLADRSSALAAEAETALAVREAAFAAREMALVAAAEASLAGKAAALAAEAEAALAAKAAALAAAAEALSAERASVVATEVETTLAAREAALATAAEASLAEKGAALAAEWEMAIAAKQAALDAAAEATIAAKVASLAAAAGADLAEKAAVLGAEASAAWAAKEAALEAAAQEIAARAVSVGTELETTISMKAAALVYAAEADAAFAERERALAVAAEAALASRLAALTEEAEAVLSARQASLAADAYAALSAKAVTLEAEAEAARSAHEAALAARAEAVLAERLAALDTEMHADRVAREAALAAEADVALAAHAASLAARAEAVLAERLAALEAETHADRVVREAALAAHAASLAAQAEAVLAERLAALEAETHADRVAREAALAAEADVALAAHAASLAARAEAVLAERLAALEAETHADRVAREAALAAEADVALAAHAASLAAQAEDVALAAHAASLAAQAEQERVARVRAVEERIAAELDAALADAHAALTARADTGSAAEFDAVIDTLLAVELPALPLAQIFAEPAIVRQGVAAAASRRDGTVVAPYAHTPEAAVVLSIGRPTLKLQQSLPQAAAPAASTEASLVELLRSAAAHRASTVYAVVDTRPMMRVEGQINVVGTEAPIAAGDVERFIFEFAPRNLVADAAPEWTCTVPGVGRVRCVTFHDQSGAGLIVDLPAADVSTADEIGLGSDIQALCGAADGLIVITGPRASGKSSMLNALVDVINRTRYDHVITIESRIRVRHERRYAFISQREVLGNGDAIASAARAALREGADVLVIEDLRAPEALGAALDAARAGRLVLGSISAPSAPVALERLVDAFPADRRPQVRASLAGALRAVVAQVLVPKIGGGRTAAREVLLSSPAVRKLLLEGATGQLPIAIESGRSLGMRPMVDALGALVRDGIVDIAEACGVAPDRAALIAALERDGVDVSAVERRA